jgi:enterochelin esterase-like enzyme
MKNTILLLALTASQFSALAADVTGTWKAEFDTQIGLQKLNFGLGHLDTFAWVGGFSSAPNTRQPAELVPNTEKAAEQLKLLFISCGNKDGLIRISQGVHAHLKENNVPHIWHVDDHAHDFQHWRKALYQFAQLIFKPDEQ